MQSKHLITMINNLLDGIQSIYSFQIYDELSMDYEKKDINKINGVARVTNGTFEATPGLRQSTATITVEFIHPVERLPEVKRVLTTLSANSAGVVFQNNLIDESLTGATGVNIVYPEHGTEKVTNLGETITSRIICFFVINEVNVLANECTFDIMNGYEEATVTSETTGTYYILSDGNYVAVTLPAQYNSEETYYSVKWERIVYYKAKLSRTLNGETDDYDNYDEKMSYNQSQAINITMSVPSIRGSVINSIKRDKIRGLNINKSYNIKLTDDDGEFVFEDMIASGNFINEFVPGSDVKIDISFVYKKKDSVE